MSNAQIAQARTSTDSRKPAPPRGVGQRGPDHGVRPARAPPSLSGSRASSWSRQLLLGSKVPGLRRLAMVPCPAETQAVRQGSAPHGSAYLSLRPSGPKVRRYSIRGRSHPTRRPSGGSRSGRPGRESYNRSSEYGWSISPLPPGPELTRVPTRCRLLGPRTRHRLVQRRSIGAVSRASLG